MLSRLGWRLIRVRGRSMEPTLRDGDLVLARSGGRGRAPRTGDVVCIRRPNEPQMIKRLGPVDPAGGFRLSGDGAASAPAIDLGVVTGEQIAARAIVRISGFGIHPIPPPGRAP